MTTLTVPSSRSNLRLKRLTQAYLSPVKGKKPTGLQAAIQEVDNIYSKVQELLLSYQSYTTGLFPRYSSDTKVAYVKDSIYAAWACWATSIAYRRLDDDRGRESELRQSAVKTMRGILNSWMLQGDKIEMFKVAHKVEHALHSKFDLMTGQACVDSKDYGHLQVDVVALFLMTLVQMVYGGVQIIYTQYEVRFVQNLVFYIERAYRTPDYGMWERGTRYNNNSPELHASSLGMTKAALEAINGFNVFGAKGTSSSVIYVDIDAHNRNRTTFETMLPRESDSKNTDASLLVTIGFPFYAIHHEVLTKKAKEKFMRRLDGRYGMRRFLRDGYKSVKEDRSRRHYTQHETSKFQLIECQWPMFYCYSVINSMLINDSDEANKMMQKLDGLLVPNREGTMVVPECYYVPEERIHLIRENPNDEDVIYYPISPIENGHFLWAQALYIIALLMKKELIYGSELDPVYRHLPASQRPRVNVRHSAFHTSHVELTDEESLGYKSGDVVEETEESGGKEGDPVVQIALISESTKLQIMLSTYGIQTQTPHEVEPVQIWPSWRLVKVFESLGKSEKLGLTGRPPRPIGSLGTSKIYRVFGDTVLCYPLVFEISDFYVSADPRVLIQDIRKDLKFVSKRWKLSGRPTVCVVLREENIKGAHFDQMLELLVALKNGYIDGTRVRTGRVQNLLGAGCVEHIDFAHPEEVDFAGIEPFAEKIVVGDYVSLRDIKKAIRFIENDPHVTLGTFAGYDTAQLVTSVQEAPDMALKTQAYCLALLWDLKGETYTVDGQTVKIRMEAVYRQAITAMNWRVVRFCAAKLRKVIDSLSPGITSILVRGKQVRLGVHDSAAQVVSKPMSPSEITAAVFSSADHNSEAGVLIQELLVECANLVQTRVRLFDGILSIRIGWLIEAMNLTLRYDKSARRSDDVFKNETADGQEPGEPSVYDCSPTMVKKLLYNLLSRSNWHQLSPMQQRQLNGALNRVPVDFHNRVWKILERTRNGIVIAGNYLPQQPTLSDMTQFELTFGFTIEEMLSKVTHPEYRQLLVELLMVVSTLLERNPELSFCGKVDMDDLIKQAFSLFAEENGIKDQKDYTPFYELENDSLNQTTTTYLTKAVVNALFRCDVKRDSEDGRKHHAEHQASCKVQ